MNLETLYIQIEAETSKIKSAVDKINAQMAGLNKAVSNASNKATKGFGTMGKAIIAAFSIKALVGFFNKFLEITKQTESFKKALAEAFDPIVLMIQPALTAMITGIAKATAWISGVIQAMTRWTGATKKQTAAAQAQKRAYAGFDELNVVPSDTGAAAPVVEPLIDTNAYIEQGKKFWEDYGDTVTGVIDDIKKMLIGLGVLMATILVIQLLNSGPVFTKLGKMFAGIFLSFSDTAAGRAAFAALPKIIQAFLNPIKLLGDMLFFLGHNLAVTFLGANAVLGMSAKTLMLIGGIFAAVIAGIIYSIVLLWQESETFRNKVKSAFEAVVGLFKALWDLIVAIGDAFVSLWDKYIKPFFGSQGAFGKSVEIILILLLTFIEVIAIGLTDAIKILTEMFRGDFSTIKGIVDDTISFFSNGWAAAMENLHKNLGSISTFFKDWGSDTAQVFKNLFNSIVRLWNDTVGKFSLDIPKWVPGIGGQKWSMPVIPYLAEGGMLNAGSLFVAGEAGAELIGSHRGQTTVMPLQNTDFTAAMGQAVYGAMISAMSSQGNGSVVINIDGMTLAKSVETNLNKLSTLQGGLKIAM